MVPCSLLRHLPLFSQTAEELMQSARAHGSRGTLLAQIAALIVAGLFVYGAYTTFKNGFTITKTTKVTGTPAKIISAMFVLIAVGIAVFMLVFFPGMTM